MPTSSEDRFNRLYGSGRQTQTSIGQDRNALSAVMNPVAGAARGLSSILEPLALPQDVFFSVLGSTFDTERSVLDNLRDIEWRKYLPGGEAPARVVSGEDLMGYFGFEDENAKRWGGIVLDLVADPLLLGSAVSAVGKMGKIEKLVKWGNRIDEVTNGRALLKNMDGSRTMFGQFIDTRVESVLKAYRDPNARVFGIPSNFAKRGVDAFVPQVTAATAALGEIGGNVFRHLGMAEQAAQDLFINSMEDIGKLQDNFLKGEQPAFFRKAMRIVGKTPRPQHAFGQFGKDLELLATKEAYEFVQRHGALTLDDVGIDALDEISDIVDAGVRVGRQDDMRETLGRIRTFAKSKGLDDNVADTLSENFQNFVVGVTRRDAELGLHLSGYDLVRKSFVKNLIEHDGLDPDSAVSVWKSVLSEGLNGRDPLDVDVTDLLGRADTTTVRDLVGNSATFAELGGLSIGAYVNGLQNGHLRRAYGMFTDKKGYRSYIRGIKEGRLISNTLIDETNALNAVRLKDPEAADALGDLQNILSNGKKTGVVTNKDDLIQHVRERLESSGVGTREAATRARDAWYEMHRATQPGLSGVISRLEAAAAKYEGRQQAGFGSFQQFAKAQEDLDQETLEVLGEFVNPLLSLFESSKGTRSRVSRRNFLESTFSLADEQGLIKSGSSYIDADGVAYKPIVEPETVLGAWSGKLVHPYLYDEVMRGIKSKDSAMPAAFNRMRSMLTGGYLAAPNVAFANLVGGIYTAALAGVGPHRMIKSLGETMASFAKNGVEHDEVLGLLRDYVAVDIGSVVTQDLAHDFYKAHKFQAGVGSQGIGKFLENMQETFMKQLESPLGQDWAGLRGFQFIEQSLKTATFRAELDDMFGKWSVSDLRTAMDAGDAETIDKVRTAAEMARIAVFDYSELPDAVKFLRDTGVLMFPGFPLFLAGRTMKALAERPGQLALADRMSEAFASASLDDEEKLRMYAGMPDWLKHDQGVPVPWTKRTDANGNVHQSFIPLAQLLPTRGFDFNPWGESLTTGGIYTPFAEVIHAHMSGTGDAFVSEQFGNRVFQPSADELTQARQTVAFLYNSLAPAALRKIVKFNEHGEFDGLASSVAGLVLPPDLLDGVNTYNEVIRRRKDRNIVDEALSAFVRSPQVLSSGGITDSMNRQYDISRRSHDEETRVLKQRLERALIAGNQTRANKMRERIVEKNNEFSERWTGIYGALQKGF